MSGGGLELSCSAKSDMLGRDGRGSGRRGRGRGRGPPPGRGPRDDPYQGPREPMVGGHDDRMGEGTDRAEADRRGGRGRGRGGRGGPRGGRGYFDGGGNQGLPPSEVAKWEYLDPQGGTRGPFSSKSMLGWHKAGYFNEMLPTRVIGARDPGFRTLQICLPNMLADCGETAPPPLRTADTPYSEVQGHPANALASSDPRASVDEPRGQGRGRGRDGGRGGPGSPRGGPGRGPQGPGGRQFNVPMDYGRNTANRLFTADAPLGAEEPVWRYIDLKGEVQGPFPANQMLGWFERGYLDTLDLSICGTERKVSPPDLPIPNVHYQRFGYLLDLVHQGSRFQPLTPKNIEEKTVPTYGPQRGGGRFGGRGEQGGRDGGRRGRGGRGRGPPGPVSNFGPELQTREMAVVPSAQGSQAERPESERYGSRGGRVGRGRRPRGRGGEITPGYQADEEGASQTASSAVMAAPEGGLDSRGGRGSRGESRGRGRRDRGRAGRQPDSPSGRGDFARLSNEEGGRDRRPPRERGEGRGRGRGRGREGRGRGRGRKMIEVELKTLEDGLVKLSISPTKRPERPERPGRGERGGRGRGRISNWNENKEGGSLTEAAAGTEHAGEWGDAVESSGAAWGEKPAAEGASEPPNPEGSTPPASLTDEPASGSKSSQSASAKETGALNTTGQEQTEAIGAEGIEKNGNLAKGVTKPTEATPVLGTTSTQSELPTISRSLPGESTREDSEAPTVEYLPGKMTVESSKSEPSMQSISSSLPGKTADNASRVESGKSGNEQILPGKMTLETSEEQILPGKMTLETSKEQALPGKMTLETLKESHTGLTSQEPANSLKDTTGGNLIDSKHEGVAGDCGEGESLNVSKAAEKKDGLADLTPVQISDSTPHQGSGIPTESAPTNQRASEIHVEYESDPSIQTTAKQHGTETSAMPTSHDGDVFNSGQGEKGEILHEGGASLDGKGTETGLLGRVQDTMTDLVESAKEKTQELTSANTRPEEKTIGQPTTETKEAAASAATAGVPTLQGSSEKAAAQAKELQQSEEKGKSGKKGFLSNLFGGNKS